MSGVHLRPSHHHPSSSYSHSPLHLLTDPSLPFSLIQNLHEYFPYRSAPLTRPSHPTLPTLLLSFILNLPFSLSSHLPLSLCLTFPLIQTHPFSSNTPSTTLFHSPSPFPYLSPSKSTSPSPSAPPMGNHFIPFNIPIGKFQICSVIFHCPAFPALNFVQNYFTNVLGQINMC